MIVFGPLGSVFDILTFRPGIPRQRRPVRSGWFVESTIIELAVMLVLRINRPFNQSQRRPGPAAGHVRHRPGVPAQPAAGPLGLTAVPAWILAALAAFYIIANEGAKHRLPPDGPIHNPRGLSS